MSVALYWSRIPVETTDECLYSLKHTLGRRVWGDDYNGDSKGYAIIGQELIPFLEGIVEGNGSGDMGRNAKELIDAINRHGKVRLCAYS